MVVLLIVVAAVVVLAVALGVGGFGPAAPVVRRRVVYRRRPVERVYRETRVVEEPVERRAYRP